MDIESIPRNITVLRALKRSERYRLFLALHVDGTSDELDSKFLNSSADKQAEHLLALLKALDTENDEDGAYCVISAALPKRSSKKKTNEKRMAVFAENIETILNDMVTTHPQVRLLQFENHGILVVGHRSPEMTQLPFSGIPAMFARIGSPLSEGSQAQEEKEAASKLDEEDRHRLHAICNQAYSMVVNSTDDELLDKNLDEFLNEVLKGTSVEITKSFIGEINRLESEHAIAHDHDESCQLGRLFEKMKACLGKRAHLNTN